MTHADARQAEKLAIAGKRYILHDHFAVIVFLGLGLAAAQTLSWNNIWLYSAAFLLIKSFSAALLVRINPAVLNARGTKRQTDKAESLFLTVFAACSLATPVVAGLDAGAPGWTHGSFLELSAGLVLAFAGFGFASWALAENAFFEPTVRLQQDRGQRVCSSGPYAIVRHPGYSGAIVGTLAAPLVLGSLWCLIPILIQNIALILRAAREDKLLQGQLDGYAEYARKVKYRIVPFVW